MSFINQLPSPAPSGASVTVVQTSVLANDKCSSFKTPYSSIQWRNQGVKGPLKQQCICYPQRNFSQTHKEYIFHLDKVLSDFPPEPLQLFLPERSTRCPGIMLNHYRSDRLSSELVNPVEKQPCVLKGPALPDSSLACSVHIPVLWDEGQSPVTVRSQPLPSRPADIQTQDRGPGPVLCTCRRVEQIRDCVEIGSVFLKGRG